LRYTTRFVATAQDEGGRMTLWTTFRELLEQVSGGLASPQQFREDELRLASAALLVHAAAVDGHFDNDERKALKEILQTRFGLADSEARQLLTDARAREQEAVDLYRFTSVLCRELDQEGRKRMVEMLWEVAYADGVVHEFESNLVWRAAELLGVSTRDRVELRKAVEARLS
jgi:uncharacterized tellurite resistance protein B-like protein